MSNPTEQYPNAATIQALNGTTDTRTGLPYIAKGTNADSSPPLVEQIDRKYDRLNSIIEPAAELRVVKVDDTHIGIYAGYFSIPAGSHHYYDGSASTAVSTTDDTYLVYIESDGSGGGTVSVVTDAVGYPVTPSTYIPLAEVVVSGNVISSIANLKNLTMLATSAVEGAEATGVDGTSFTLDQDNAGSGEDSELLFNRGSTAGDASLKWNETEEQFEIIGDSDDPYGALGSLAVGTLDVTVSDGTPPIVTESTTVCTNLNADTVDGIGFDTSPTAANEVVYSADATTLKTTNTPTAGDVLIADAGVPTFAALGSDSGVQEYSAELDGLAALADTGIVTRVADDTYTVRELSEGANISITNADGVSGDIQIAVSGVTQYAIPVGSAAGSLTSLTVGADNTVLAGNTGANPVFRKLVDADVAEDAEIAVSKLGSDSSGILCTDGLNVLWKSMIGDVSINADEGTTSLRPWVELEHTTSGGYSYLTLTFRDPTYEVWTGSATDLNTFDPGVLLCSSPVKTFRWWFASESGSPSPCALTEFDSLTVDTYGANIETDSTNAKGFSIPANGLYRFKTQLVSNVLEYYLFIEINGYVFGSQALPLEVA